MARHSSLLVGCGSRAQYHARALVGSDRFDLTAVCDLLEERATSTADAFDVPAVYTSVEDAVRAESPTHVSVLTPPTVRLPLVTDLLATEPPSLLLEKPVANTLSGVRQIADAADSVDTRVTVCHQKPWADEVRAVKRWIDEDRLGAVSRCLATTKLGIASQGTHFVHALNWLLDARPIRVHGWSQGPESLQPGETGHVEPADVLFELTYPDDTRAVLHQGWEAPDIPDADSPSLEYKLDVIGSEGRAEFVLGHHAAGIFRDGSERVDARPFDEDAYMTRGLYQRLADVLEGTTSGHPADLASAVAAHRTTDAALRSAVEGRAVAPGENPPDIGATTVERLRQSLAGRRPIVVSSLLYGDRDRAAALDSLADLGVHHVDLWGTEIFVDHHFDPRTESIETVRADLDRAATQVPVVSIYDQEPVEAKLRFAAELGAETAVMGGRTPDRPATWDPDRLHEWLAVAEEVGMTLAFENHLDTLETVAEMQSLMGALDHPSAGICLAPSHLRIAGEDAAEAVARLGSAIEVCYLWDIEPDVARSETDELWYDRADSQVPGGGGAVDFERYLEGAVEYCPDAHWVLCYHGTEEWGRDRIEQSISRSLRHLERRRPRASP